MAERIYSHIVQYSKFTSGFQLLRALPGQEAKPHRGVDLAVVSGTSVHVPASGQVYYAGWINGYGNTVVVAHPSAGAPQSFTLYAHLESLSVAQNDLLVRGQQVGLSGSSGSTAQHLHYEERAVTSPVTLTQSPEARKQAFLVQQAVDPAENRFGFGTWNPAQVPRNALNTVERRQLMELSDTEFEAYKRRVATIESGKGMNDFLRTGTDDAEIKYSTNTGNGAYGAYQFQPIALKAAGFLDAQGQWTPKAAAFGVGSFQDFVASPQAQDAALKALVVADTNFLVARGYDSHIGSAIGGVDLTKLNLLLAAHHRRESVGEFITSNGATDIATGSNPPISKYLMAGAGLAEATGQPAPQQSGYWAEIPYYHPEWGTLVSSFWQWVTGSQTPASPTPSVPTPQRTSLGATYISRDGASAILANGQVIEAGPGGRLTLEADGGVTVTRPAAGYSTGEEVFDVVTYSGSGVIKTATQFQMIRDPAHPVESGRRLTLKQGELRDITIESPDGSSSFVSAAFQVGTGWVDPGTGEVVKSLGAWANTEPAQQRNAFEEAFFQKLVELMSSPTPVNEPGVITDSIMQGLQLAAATTPMTDAGFMTDYGGGRLLHVSASGPETRFDTYDAVGRTGSTTLQAQPDGSITLQVRDSGGNITTTINRRIFDDGSELSEVKDHSTNESKLIAKESNDVVIRDTTALRSGQKSKSDLEAELAGDVSSFLGAIRSHKTALKVLYGAKIVFDTFELRKMGGETAAGLNNFLGGVGDAVSILSALRGLQSDDLRVQISSAVGLLNNANSLVKRLQGTNGTGFLSQDASKFLGAVGAVMSIAALGDLDDMIENKQYGAAITTVANAINGVGFFASGMTEAFFFIPGPWMVAIMVFAAILDSEAEEPPPPPPVGEVVFKRLGDGSLGYEILNAANGGQEILAGQLDALLVKLNQQLLEANQGNTDPDRELHMIASRMPKIALVSWPSHQAGTNYFFSIQQVHPTTGELVYSGIARQDLVKHFAEAMVLPEAIVQKWTINHLSAKFGPDEANWKTEGQFLADASAVEQQRKSHKQSVEAAEDAVSAARENNLQAGAWVADGDVTGNVSQGQSAAQAAVAAAEAALAAAQAALEAFEAANPADPQMAARIIDPAITDRQQMEAAREAAKRQWLKAIAVDLGGDGIQTTALPAVVGKDLDSIQTDGVTRFDVDNDGYREATQWIAASDAILGIDRDGNGVLDSANELFNGISTPFDQRGLASLKYYDTNGDNRIDAVDPVYKLLRLWIDLNGDGSAGTMETYDLQMRHPGVDMAALSARLDAAGQAAMAALQNSAVQYIDLSTFQLHLADQTTSQATEVALQSEVEGIMIAVDEQTQNISVLHENGLRENYITLVEDMSALLELDNPSITAARRTELEALALRYGLNTQAADFMTVVRSLRAGGENMGATGAAVYFGSDDVWADPNVRTRLEQMRFSFHSATSVGSADVFGTARIGTPIAIGAGTSTPVFNDGWLPAHHVQQGEVTSDTPTAAPPPPNPERWVLLSDVYNLDHVVRGAQLGGLVTQQAVIASNAAVPNAPQQTIQVYTTAAPTLSLDAVTISGGEDEQFGFGFTQLEQEARTLIPGSTAATAVRLLGVRSVAHGRVEINEELGRVQFIADANYYGTEAGFSYAVMDDQGRVLERRVHFNLAEVNDGPNVLGETIQAQEDVPLLLDAATLLANDSDLEGDSLSIIGIGRVGMGRAELLQNGQIRYTPPADLYGVTDTIEYIVQDARGASAVAVVKITLHAVDDAPTVVSEVIRNAKEDTNLRIDPALLLANDYDADFHNQVGAEQLRITAVGSATHGTAFLDASGTVIFVPAESYNGTATFEYTVTDSTGLSTVGKAEVEVGAVNDGPRAFGELITSQEDQKLVIDPDLLLANDDDLDIARGENQRLMVVAVDQAVNGTVKLENGHVSFTPTHNFNGEASFRYTVSDGAGGFARAIARIAISAENDAPVVLNRSYIGQEDTAYFFTPQQLLDGVLDPEDAAAGLQLVNVGEVTGATLELVDGQYVLTPGANFNGVASFQYTVADAQGAQSTGQVSVKFNSVNDAPVFIPGSAFTKQGEEDQAVRISVEAIKKMFVDVDGDALSIDTATLAAVQAGDTVSYDADRQEIVFKAAANANGLRHFDVRVLDSQGAYSTTQRLGVDIKALNDSPIVNAVAFKVLEDGGWNDPTKRATNYISYSLLLNHASDADGDTLSIHSVGNARTGDGREVTIFQDPTLNRLGFVTPLNYNGTVSFDFTVSDGKGGLTTQKAYGTVVPVDDVPTVQAVRLGSAYGMWDYWRLDAHDVDGSIVGYGIDRNPLRGTVTLGQALTWWPGGYVEVNNGDAVWTGYSEPGYTGGPVPGGPNDVMIMTLDGKGYAAETQTAVLTATDNGGNVARVNLSFVFRWDPVVIDLDSDGLEFIDISDSSVLIDRDGDGTQERSAWVKGTEGILAWDHNADGAINRYDEIEFWTHVQPEDPARTDLQSLARPEFDSNQDGVFNSQDTKWGEFKLWRDLNENGVSDAGELATLDEAGVAALHLHANVLNRRYGADVVVRGYTRLEMTDGRMLTAGDVQLSMADPTTPSLATPPTTEQQQAGTATEAEYQAALAQEAAALAAARSAGDPNFTGPLGEQKVLVGSAYRYVLPADLFPALGAEAAYAVTLANGQPLPVWLAYDSATRTLSGTPQSGQLGNWAIKVTGTDTAAEGGATASSMMTLEVASFNQAPLALGHLPAQFALEDESFALDIAPNFFVDREAGDTLRYSATLADGSQLPSWLSFDPATLAFRGTPPGAAVGTLEIVLKALDEANASARVSFKLIVEGLNDAPVVANAPAMVGMRVGEANSYALPADMFVDADAGDVLQWTATLANGEALPSWLSFDPASRTLNGAPTPEQLAAPVQLRVKVTDMAGASTSTLVTVTSTIYGTNGADALQGSNYSEDLWGEAGNDTLDGRGGADRLIGGQGDDTYLVDNLDTVIELAGQGQDTVVSAGTWTLDSTLENLTLTGSAAADGTGNEGDNLLRGNAGANVLTGAAGNDTYYVDATDTVIEQADAGLDTVYASGNHTLSANVENLVLLGSEGLRGTGNDEANTISGSAGNDTLDGGAGADTLAGGAGDDTYYIDAHDTVQEQPDEGIDTIVTDASYVLASVFENLVLTGTNAADGTGNAADNFLAGNAGANVLTGLDGNDTYEIDALDTVVEQAGGGIDSVRISSSYVLGANVENLYLTGEAAVDGTGNALDNILSGNSGANVLTGGLGNDVYMVDSASDQVVEQAGEGVDTVQSSATFALGANVENLTLSGAAAINGTGNILANVLAGNSAANILAGGGGSDTLSGNGGNDTLLGDSEAPSFAARSVLRPGFVVSSSWVNNNTYPREMADVNGDGRADIVGFGSDGVYLSLTRSDGSFGDSFRAMEAFGTAHGWSSNDAHLRKMGDVNGDGFADIVGFSGLGAYVALSNGNGSFGGSYLASGGFAAGSGGGRWTSNDTMPREIADVNGDGRADIVGFREDAVYVSLAQANGYFGAPFLATTGFVSGSGWSNNNTTPRRLADVNGDGRADIVGFANDGTYVALADGNGGFGGMYKAHYAFGQSTGWTSQNAMPREVADINGDGRADLVGFDAGALWIALGQADGYFGTATSLPTQFGSADGMTNNDQYPRRLADINGDGRADLIGFAHDATYGALSAAASGDDILNGGDGDDLLQGMAGADTLDGGAGVDTMEGGAGNDTYYVDNTADVVREAAIHGSDTVYSSATYTLASQVETLILTGNAAINGTGNALTNWIYGNAADNVLDGGAGWDRLAGGQGNDTYYVDNDTIDEYANEGTDTVHTASSYTLGTNVENLTLTGTAVSNGTGNIDDNVLVGNTAANILTGGAGNDTLYGMAGDDTLRGDAAVPTFGPRKLLSPSYSINYGWSNDNAYPRMMADVDGDGRADIVGFASDGVYISLAQAGAVFGQPYRAAAAFGNAHGWTSNDVYLRTMADVNGDGKADIVGFASSGVNVALSLGNGYFGNSFTASNAFGPGTAAGGWNSNDYTPRELADVNGDGRADIVGFGTYTTVSLANADGTFQSAFTASTSFAVQDGFNSNNTYPRKLADVNGDGMADIVGFAYDGIHVALGTSTGMFGARFKASPLFGSLNGWTTQNALPRELGDINGDGRADVVGFDGTSMWVALGQQDGTFGSPSSITTEFGSAHGMTNNNEYPRELADIDGDGRADIVGFGYDGVYAALSTTGTGDDTLYGGDGNDVLQGMAGTDNLSGDAGNDTLDGGADNDSLSGGAGDDALLGDTSNASFAPRKLLYGGYSINAGWSNQNTYPREMADVNGDGRADIVGFASDGIYISLAQAGAVFGQPYRAAAAFGNVHGWTSNDVYLRTMADVNGDGKADIVGFASSGVNVALSLGNGYFGNSFTASNAFGPGTAAGGWNSNDYTPRELADVNGDGRADIVGFGTYTTVSLANADGTFQSAFTASTSFAVQDGFNSNNTYPRKLADVNGDGMADIVGFAYDGIHVALGTSTGMFGARFKAMSGFGTAGGFTTQNALPREVADVNGDGRADMVAFDANHLWVALGKADGTFATATQLPSEFGNPYGMTNNNEYPRTLADIDGDGRADIIGFAYDGVYAAVSTTTSGDDMLFGDAGNDLLQGLSGADTLDGGLGADTLEGGAGNDTYVVDDGGDVVREAAGAGTDSVLSSISYVLGAQLENLTLTGSASINGVGNARTNVLQGNSGSNVLFGMGSGDTLRGGAGNDALVVQAAGDSWDYVLEGGLGDDLIVGSHARDLYQYALGDGDDTIIDNVTSYAPGAAYFGSNQGDPTYQDTLQFGAGISAADITVRRKGYDAVLQVASGGSITVQNWFHGYNTRLEKLTFADGTVWTAADVDARVLGVSMSGGQMTGSIYNDTLHATQVSAWLVGGAGDDVLAAKAASNVGSVTFDGGAGADSMVGSYCMDTYKFNLGDGHDTILDDVRVVTNSTSAAVYFATFPATADYQDRLEFGAGITAADVSLSRQGDDLKFSLSGGTDSITVKQWFNGIFTRLEQVKFANGTTWNADQIESMMGLTAVTSAAGRGVNVTSSGTLAGGAGGDVLAANGASSTLLGGAGNDTLVALVNGGAIWDLVFEGGTGNDHMTGSYARDLYRFNRGDGQDIIRDDVGQHAAAVPYYQQDPERSDYQDKLLFGAGITADQLWFQQSGWDLEVSVIGTSDKVTINDWYWSNNNRIEVFQLADGKRLTDENVQRLVHAMAGFAPPPAGQTTLSQPQQAVLGAEIAASWK